MDLVGAEVEDHLVVVGKWGVAQAEEVADSMEDSEVLEGALAVREVDLDLAEVSTDEDHQGEK